MTIEKKQHGYNFKFPATEEGYKFVEEIKKNLNKDSYKVTVRFSGPDSGGYVKKDEATHLRIYITSLREEDNPWKTINILTKLYNKGAKHYKEQTKVRELLHDVGVDLKQENELLNKLIRNEGTKVKNLNKIVKEQTKQLGVLGYASKKQTELEEENRLLTTKLSILNSYIKSMSNSSHNPSRRISGLKEVAKTIDSLNTNKVQVK